MSDQTGDTGGELYVLPAPAVELGRGPAAALEPSAPAPVVPIVPAEPPADADEPETHDEARAELERAAEAAWRAPDQLAERVAGLEQNAVSVQAWNGLVSAFNRMADRLAQVEILLDSLGRLEPNLLELSEMHRELAPPAPLHVELEQVRQDAVEQVEQAGVELRAVRAAFDAHFPPVQP